MLKGFEEYTAPLDEYEQKVLLPLLIQGLKTMVGKENDHKEIEDWIETAQGRINALVASSEALKRQFKKIKSESTDLEKDLGIEVCKCSSPDSVPVNDELSVCLSCGLNIN